MQGKTKDDQFGPVLNEKVPGRRDVASFGANLETSARDDERNQSEARNRQAMHDKDTSGV